MNKKLLISTVIVIMLVVCVASLSFNTVYFNEKSICTAKFVYEDISIEPQISDKHLEQVVNIFKNKRLCIDNPSCSFSENVSLKIDDKTFCIACDGCGVIYLLEKDKYFYLNNKENEILRNLLKSYGFIFPCL